MDWAPTRQYQNYLVIAVVFTNEERVEVMGTAGNDVGGLDGLVGQCQQLQDMTRYSTRSRGCSQVRRDSCRPWKAAMKPLAS